MALRSRQLRPASVGLLALLAVGCRQRGPERCSPLAHAAVPPAAATTHSLACSVPGQDERAFSMELPEGWDGASPLPLLIAFHGGGGNRRSAERVTCPGGDLQSPGCLSAVARSRGVAVVHPDGTAARLLPNVRTWNAGGGRDGLNCTSGRACREGVDDVRYFDALLAEVKRLVPVDARRVFLTGLSNGGAISHRLACERSEQVAAIVAVGGSNQFAAAHGACPGGVAVLEIHGTADPCWSFAPSEASCLEGENAGIKAGTLDSMEGWRLRNGCGDAVVTTPLPDRAPDDGTTASWLRWPGCKAAVELIRVDGGGHTWPGGFSYQKPSVIGPVSRDFGNEVVLDFLLAHPKP